VDTGADIGVDTEFEFGVQFVAYIEFRSDILVNIEGTELGTGLVAVCEFYIEIPIDLVNTELVGFGTEMVVEL
jgi:hypothetical protein